MTRRAFKAYLEQFLVPKLRPGDVVRCDNLSAHKRVDFATLVARTEAELVYVPPSSPDLTPIEPIGSQVKSWLRCWAAQAREDLKERVAGALPTVTPNHARNYVRFCGHIVNLKCKLL